MSMNRVEAIREIVARHPDAAIVFSNGLTSREASFAADRSGNFYLLHGMGEALSVGIGLKLARPNLEVVVIDGDGNAAMGLAATALLPIDGLHYYVLDNHVYETTGSQPAARFNFKHESMQVIEIEKGTICAPLPPKPEKIIDDFLKWINSDR
jgi:thiamine pyrophosphate-dependent acetolactate synthase large subunit-like protein